MIDFSGIRNIYIANHKVDFRKSYDGLLAEAYQMGLDPIAGDMILYVGRCKRKLKILFCDKNGIWVLSKRFHKGGFKRYFKFVEDPSQSEISQAELGMFVAGLQFEVKDRIAHWPNSA